MTIEIRISLGSTVRRQKDILTQQLDDDLVMADLDAGAFYGLAQSGKQIWRLIETPQTVSSICDSLMSQFSVDRGECEKDVLAFLRDLETEGLVQVTG